jgi:hypothetical protein
MLIAAVLPQIWKVSSSTGDWRGLEGKRVFVPG